MKGLFVYEVEGYFSQDPMKLAGVQEYRIIEFILHDCLSAVKIGLNRIGRHTKTRAEERNANNCH
jgi:hypothetical protein